VDKEKSVKEKFALLMMILNEAFEAGRELTAERLDVYYNYLKDISMEKLGWAVNKIVATGDYRSMPQISEIRKIALCLEDQDIESRALSAWSFATENLTLIRQGELKSPAMISEAVKMAFGSWETFSKTEVRNDVFDRAHFLKCFKAFAKMGQNERLLEGVKPKELKK